MGFKNDLIMREPCPICGGRRIIKDPTGFWARLARAEAEAPGGRFDELTFARYLMDHCCDPHDPDTWPVEEETCNVCDANGMLEIRTSLEEAPEPATAATPENSQDLSCSCEARDALGSNPELCECSP